MVKILLILFASLSLYAQSSEFEMFKKFEKQDKSEFKVLKSKIEKCIKNWDFVCAQKDLSLLKNYVTTKNDVETVVRLKNNLSYEKDRKKRQEEEALLKQKIAHSRKSIRIGDCRNGNGGYRGCSLYVNGSYDGSIFYKLKNDNTYDIYILGSKNAGSNGGYYSTSLHSVWTTQCGDSVFGSSSKKIFVYDLEKALYMYADCYINGTY